VKVGAEPRKVAILAGLLAVAGYLYFSGATSEEPPRAVPRTAPAVSPPPPDISRPRPVARPSSRTEAGREFRPSLKRARPEDRPDPMTVDPTLRLDLLAKLQDVHAERIQRSLFDFSAPPPKMPEPKVVPVKQVAETNDKAEPPKPVEAEAKPAKPAPPPIPLKFYGFISPVQSADKRAFFLDGEEIFVAGEGDLIRKRYKVVRIGVSSAVVEDTEHNHQQTLPLVEQRG
jgi:hypothetical protein